MSTSIPHSKTYLQHAHQLFILAYPVILGQLGHIMVGLTDTFMAGQLGGTSIAAVTFAFSFYFPFLLFGIGLSYGPSPLIAKAQGEENYMQIKSYFWHSLYMNVFTGLLLTGFIFFSANHLLLFNKDVALVTRATPFLHLLALSVFPVMIFQSFRQFAEGLSSTRPAMFISIIGNVMNILLNWALAKGAWGFPELGLNGIAIATLISRVFMAVLMIGYVLITPSLNQYLKGANLFIHWGPMKTMLKKSFPVGIQLSLESGVFSLGAIFIGWISATAIASHQIALNLAAVSYMAATGLGAAVSVRVGYEWGAGNKSEIRKAGLAAFMMVSVFMLSVSVLFILFRHQLPALFVSEQDIIQTTASLLLTAALFQLADGIQVVGIGSLRGIGDVTAPTVISFLAYWALGLPIGYVLAFHYGMGVYGIWYGFTIGLFLAAILLFGRFMLLSGRIMNK